MKHDLHSVIYAQGLTEFRIGERLSGSSLCPPTTVRERQGAEHRSAASQQVQHICAYNNVSVHLAKSSYPISLRLRSPCSASQRHSEVFRPCAAHGQ